MPNVCLCATDTAAGNVAGDRRFRFVAHAAVDRSLLLLRLTGAKEK
jgi:hypothetical protein